MKFINVKDNKELLREYIKLCSLEWGCEKTDEEMEQYINEKEYRILNEDNVINIIGLMDNDEMIGFISLFKYDGDECRELTPWYATMYVKKEYRGNGYSKILNDELLRQTKEMGYDKLYLKSELENYYEKFGAKYIKMLENGEKLYYIDLEEV